MTNDLLKCVQTKEGNVVTPRGRAHFCAIAEKFLSKTDKAKGKTIEKDGAFVVTLVVPANADLSMLRGAIKAKAADKWGDKLPGNLKSPIRLCKDVFDKNGDSKYPAELGDCFQITANTYKQQPGVVDRLNNPVNKLQATESTEDMKARVTAECYSGRWMRISVAPATYDNDGNRGVKLYLQNVQLLDHDEVLGGRSSHAENDFVPVAEAGDTAPVAAAGTADSVFG